MQNFDIEEIYNEHFKIVYKYLICLTHNREIAEDLTQETFCKAISHISDFRGTCKISVWLCEIAKNLWFNELRKNNNVSLLNLDYLNIDEHYNIEEDFLIQEDKRNLYEKISILNNPIRKIFYLKLFGDLTFKEIGEIMGKSEVWVRVNFYRAKQKLKEMIDNEK